MISMVELPCRGQGAVRKLLAALLLIASTSCATPGTGQGPLEVASDLDNAPFAFVDGEGTPKGRDVEMMEELASRLGRELVWVRMPFAELLPTVEEGRVDAVCATMGITPERAERVSFTRPYYRTMIAVVVRSRPGEPRQLAELRGRSVSGAAGTTSERAIRQHLPGALLAVTDKDAPTWQRLQSGEIDAAVCDGPAADAMVAASGGLLRRLEESLGGEDYALVVPRGETTLREALDSELAELEAEGWLAELDARFGL